MAIEVYYDKESFGVNVTVHTVQGVHYDFFNSMYAFKCWVSMECPSAKLIEVTDENYEQLRDNGKVS